MHADLRLGQFIEGNRPGVGRDAIHIAVAPVVASHDLRAGDHIGFVHDGSADVGTVKTPIGIVDPFISPPEVPEGTQFWMFLYPNSVTGLRHEWKHPAFDGKPAVDEAEWIKSQQWLKAYAAKMNCYDSPDKAYADLLQGLKTGDLFFHGSDLHGLYELDNAEELREHAERVLGITINWNDFQFSCSC